ncbi:LytTR family transcriptional regulator [Fertoebacter nigrum]|uniref:LytTR family transcriptional regulator n=1 Tax=Fertoeibacter niger TaxID=2656921 RepID=A0A8X8GWF4_9RHOB|nr:LytTR family DNA-binding domain-containing protein [Fertoeibacter niger]NUB45624.1 LytTR family transcriptional regulator [Fertoeibacter niger]
MVRNNFRPRADFVQAARAYNTHPVLLYSYLLPLTMLFTGIMKPEYPDLQAPALVGHLLTTIKVAMFWAFSWGTLGHVAWFVMQRGLPFFVAPVGLWMVAVTLSQVISLFVVPDFTWSGPRIFRQATLTLPGTFVAVYACAPMLRERLGHLPELVPIWRVQVTLKVPLLLKLPADRRGRLRRMHSANQYIEVVTEKGTTLLRMTLRDAVAMVPEAMGWQCHRSLWIRRDEVVALSYRQGQAQITDLDGQVWPVSRASAPEIRDWLSAHPKTPPAEDAGETTKTDAGRMA